jgi:peptide/nickel transport system substrate-binding protein
MPDAATKAAALANGEIDWWENPPNDLLPLLRRSREIVTASASPLGTVGSGIFNCLQPPFDKPAVRRAVVGAMSQADFMIAAAGTEPGIYRDNVGIFTPGTPLANAAGMEIITRPRDLERSKRELREAGYNGERVVLMGASDQPALTALSEVGRDLLVKIGMNVDFQVMDWGSVVQRRASREPVDKGGWSMFHTTWFGIDSVNPLGYQVLRSNGRMPGSAGPARRRPRSCGWPGSTRRTSTARSGSRRSSRARSCSRRPICRPGSISPRRRTGGTSRGCWRGSSPSGT